MPEQVSRLSPNRIETEELNARQFNAAFNKINNALSKTRTKQSKRSLTPARLKGKSKADLIKLGHKSDGTPFTREDLLVFDKQKKALGEKFNSGEKGIPVAQVISASRSIDIKRANNTVDDNTGVTTASIVGMKSDVLIGRVKASAASKYTDHRVQIRLESYVEHMTEAEPTQKGYINAAKKAMNGNISFDCDCGRHQYWYRYLATIGGFALSPKEFAFPKIKNPRGHGVACKHVLLTINKMQSVSWLRLVASEMSKSARKDGFGDDPKTSNVIFDDAEIEKSLKSNRRGKIDQAKYKEAYDKHLKTQKKMAKRASTDKQRIAELESLLLRARKENAKLYMAQTAATSPKKPKAKQQKPKKPNMEEKLKGFMSNAKDLGVSKDNALAAFAKKHKTTIEKLKSMQAKK
ncbi:hypothetical protein KO527_05345 [Pseudoalteromonas sp. C2R02]|uniref:hypothetical protein n=1 Tax=Pseudoalteromonas sp. C2R02 TaxID=2841565 RepID=UPI001C08B579|nr:hypothetical protein [Pseudoalteromonas sp. C2R02]MBU2968773.1 hypothetical protein [Pseudoalteromonas sp. C2R02]